MLHVEQGKWMRTLVHVAKSDRECAIPMEWLNLMHSKATTYAKRLSLVADAYGENSGNGTRREIRLTKRERRRTLAYPVDTILREARGSMPFMVCSVR